MSQDTQRSDRTVTVAVVGGDSLGRTEVLALYDAVGWSAYTTSPDVLVAALAGSHRVVVARTPDGDLLGLARSVSDGHSIVYVQDVLVRPDRQRTGLGRTLLHRLLAEYDGVRQRVLLTDAEPSQRAFYEALGFLESHDMRPELRAFVQSGHQD